MERAELMALVRATGCAVERGGMLLLGDERARANVQHPTSNIERPTSNFEHRTGGARTRQVDGTGGSERTLNAQHLTLNAHVGETARANSKPETQNSEPALGWLGIATGGSGGAVKFARHDERTLTSAVNGFCAHFEMEQVNAVDVLPAYHVSGLMARVRCAATGGEHVAWDWKRLEAGERPMMVPGKSWVISLVPTQLQRLLASAEAVTWLRRFKIIFLGGGPVWSELADAAARAELPVSLSYGMTETAAMVAALRPKEFPAGARSCGRALPHVKIDVVAEGGRLPSSVNGAETRGEDTPPTDGVVGRRDGLVRIGGESVFRGYWPETQMEREFTTEDLGCFDERGHLHILGRRDAVIISGGKKVQPAEVEAALRASGEFSDVAVIGLPDAEWGEAVVACYPAQGKKPDLERAVVGLAGFQRPKRFVAFTAEAWPRNAQGKINRAELRRIATEG